MSYTLPNVELLQNPRNLPPKRVDDLFSNVTNHEWLRFAMNKLKPDRAPGPDGIAVAHLTSNRDRWDFCRQLSRIIASGEYEPGDVRRVEVPKPGKRGVRLISIQTLRDRIVDKTLSLLLREEFAPMISTNGFSVGPDSVIWLRQ